MSFILKPQEPANSFENLLKDVPIKFEDDVAVIDGDYIKFAAASAGETRHISVTHPDWDEPREFKNRTELWGRSKKVVGGWIEQRNVQRELKGLEPYTKEEFTVEDVQVPEPLGNVLHTTKLMLIGVLKKLGTVKYKLFIGDGKSWRVGRSTLKEYKGQRAATLKPIHLQAVADYMVEKLGAVEVNDTFGDGVYEVDDWVIMEATGKDNHIVAGIDKDGFSQPVRYYNPDKPDLGVINCDCFGRLRLDSKGKVRGYGRQHLYFQMCSQDTADNYKANCQSKKKWGEKSAYNVLSECKNDKEAWRAMVGIFKKLYPEEQTITNFREDEITFDWLYVMQEMLDMARMKRSKDDEVFVVDVLKKMRIDYE